MPPNTTWRIATVSSALAAFEAVFFSSSAWSLMPAPVLANSFPVTTRGVVGAAAGSRRTRTRRRSPRRSEDRRPIASRILQRIGRVYGHYRMVAIQSNAAKAAALPRLRMWFRRRRYRQGVRPAASRPQPTVSNVVPQGRADRRGERTPSRSCPGEVPAAGGGAGGGAGSLMAFFCSAKGHGRSSHGPPSSAAGIFLFLSGERSRIDTPPPIGGTERRST